MHHNIATTFLARTRSLGPPSLVCMRHVKSLLPYLHAAFDVVLQISASRWEAVTKLVLAATSREQGCFLRRAQRLFTKWWVLQGLSLQYRWY